MISLKWEPLLTCLFFYLLQPYSRGNEVIETSVLGDGAAPGQHKRDEKRAIGRGYVTSWLQGNSAKHLITAVPGNLNLSKKIPRHPCLIAVDGCRPVMHDNACGSGCSLPALIAVSLHSRWWTQSSDPARGAWARAGGGAGGWRGLEQLLMDTEWLVRK